MQTQFCSGIKRDLLYQWEGRCVFRVTLRPMVRVSEVPLWSPSTARVQMLFPKEAVSPRCLCEL